MLELTALAMFVRTSIITAAGLAKDVYTVLSL